MNSKKEEFLHLKICEYIRRKYPYVIFRTDFSSGMKMTPFQAKKHKRFQSSRAYPDLFIAQANSEFAGLFLELKAEGIKLYKKDGTLRKNPHIEEQAKMLKRLRNRGYKAEFAVGFVEAKRIIDLYLNNRIEVENE